VQYDVSSNCKQESILEHLKITASGRSAVFGLSDGR
jgi:hypothetical protein